MNSPTQNIQPIVDFLHDWIESTERIVGAGLRKNRVKITDTSKKNIRIILIQSLQDVSVEIYFRDALRFVDMGAGNGYHKGVRIGRGKVSDKGRKRKKIINRPLYRRLQRLQSGIATKIIEDFTSELHSIN